MIASFPMYDRPETRPGYERLWTSVRGNLLERQDFFVDLPVRLTHHDDLWTQWEAPDLVLSQTCGLAFVTDLHKQVDLVGTLDFGLPGCPAGHYNSVIVVRAGENRTAPEDWPQLRLAFNGRDSQSGWGAPMLLAEKLQTQFASVLETGAHRQSVAAIAEERADIAAIDAHTWRMIQRWDDVSNALKELVRTEPTPAPPLITALRDHQQDIAASVETAVHSLPDEDAATLGIAGLAHLSAQAYMEVPLAKPLHLA